jgi:hypothetical protein
LGTFLLDEKKFSSFAFNTKYFTEIYHMETADLTLNSDMTKVSAENVHSLPSTWRFEGLLTFSKVGRLAK